VNLIAVHAVFSNPAQERLKRLSDEGLLNRILVTDTVQCPDCLKEGIPKLEVVPSAELSAQIIATIVENGSLSSLLDTFNAEAYLREPRLL
jgi:ribose-phosphate pyrophosphokinase